MIEWRACLKLFIVVAGLLGSAPLAAPAMLTAPPEVAMVDGELRLMYPLRRDAWDLRLECGVQVAGSFFPA